ARYLSLLVDVDERVLGEGDKAGTGAVGVNMACRRRDREGTAVIAAVLVRGRCIGVGFKSTKGVVARYVIKPVSATADVSRAPARFNHTLLRLASMKLEE